MTKPPDSLDLRILGTGIRLVMRDLPPAMAEAVRLRLARFSAPGETPELTVNCILDPEVPLAPHGEPATRDAHGLLRFGHRASQLERSSPSPLTYRLRTAWADHRPIENALRVLLSEHLRPSGGLLFHAAGIEFPFGAVLFPGVSGAGKTTLSRRFPLVAVLSDEMPGVRLDSSGATAAATPFFGDLGAGVSSATAPLSMVCLLGPKGQRSLRRATEAETMQGLLSTAVAYSPDATTARQAELTCARLSKAVPVWVLSTDLDEDAASITQRLATILP